MSGGDRLSSLPDDLLHRILHFAPAREAESTSALSKRWRGLWRSSGAVNLEERLDDEEAKDFELEDERFFSRRDAFVCAARLSLEAAGSPVTRLTFRMEVASGSSRYKPFHFLYVDTDGGMSTDVVAEFLSLPAARRVEELRLAVGYSGSGSGSGSGHHISSNREVMSTEWPDAWSFNTLKVISLPSENLRVLDITGFKYPEPSVGGVAFPVLASLRLSLCRVWAEHLQDIIHTAPVLATVHLDSVIFLGENPNKKQPPPEQGLVIRLHCPAATALVLDRCCWAEKMHQGRSGTTAVEINAPRLRRFTYKGFLRRLSLSSQAPELARVELHILPHVYHSFDRDARRDLQTFWQLAQNFSNAKELKLRVNSLENIAVVGKASRAELLCSFRNLERLELEGRLTLEEKTAAVSIANLLKCCPVLRDLRINLTTANADKGRGDSEGRCYLEKKYRHDLNKSIHAFKNRRSEPMVSTERDYDDDAILCDKLPKLPGLTGHVFHCLQSSLSCFRLQFRLETTDISGVKSTNRFGVKLIRFFAENAMVLKEMHIDAGNAKMFAHINSKVEKWVANSSEKRKMSFIVLPLER